MAWDGLLDEENAKAVDGEVLPLKFKAVAMMQMVPPDLKLELQKKAEDHAGGLC